MYYYPLQPPYFLLLIGFLVALTSGFALSGTLKVIVQKWSSDGTENAVYRSPIKQLFVPFLGITGGVGLFLTSGLEIFGFPPVSCLWSCCATDAVNLLASLVAIRKYADFCTTPRNASTRFRFFALDTSRSTLKNTHM